MSLARKQRRLAAKKSGKKPSGSLQQQAAEIDQQFATAQQYHQSGQLEQAQQLYQKILEVHPGHAPAIHYMGVLAFQAKQLGEAEKFFLRSLELHEDPVAFKHLGQLYGEVGNHERAIIMLSRAVELSPDFVDALAMLGVMYEHTNQPQKSLEAMQRVIEHNPNHVEAWVGMGKAYELLYQPERALEAYKKAAELDPNSALFQNNLGSAYREVGELDKAKEHLNNAIRLAPTFGYPYNNLGSVYIDLGEAHKAVEAYEKAAELEPNIAIIRKNLAESYYTILKFRKSVETYKEALKLDPNFDESIGGIIRSKQRICDWEDWDEVEGKIRERVDADGGPFSGFYTLNLTAEQQLKAARHWTRARIAREPIYQHDPKEWQKKWKEGEPLKIGYLSSDYFNHATTHLIAELFELHDRKNIKSYAYCCNDNDNSDIRKRVEQGVDVFHDFFQRNDSEIAQQIHDDGIHILIDLKGYTLNNRSSVCALRPAPINVNYLGFPCTMGADFIDYIIADNTIIPENLRHYYDEKVLAMPNSYQINDRKRVISDEQPTRAELGLPEDAFVFASMNDCYKITPQIFERWANILNAVPNSVLWILENTAGEAEENLRAHAQRIGLDPDRLIFCKHIRLRDHLSRIRQADLLLDTFPVCAHTTASDALWSGVPILTCMGETFVARVAGSLLNVTAVPELVTESFDDYEKKAIELANDPEQLAALRKTINDNRDSSTLFDSQQFTDDLERGYQAMWQRFIEGNAPDHIDL